MRVFGIEIQTLLAARDSIADWLAVIRVHELESSFVAFGGRGPKGAEVAHTKLPACAINNNTDAECGAALASKENRSRDDPTKHARYIPERSVRPVRRQCAMSSVLQLNYWSTAEHRRDAEPSSDSKYQHSSRTKQIYALRDVAFVCSRAVFQ